MAYFLPTGRVLRTLNRSGHRGARLTLIVPGASDVPVVQRATRFLYWRLLERGVEIYERQRSMLHSKAMVVDDRYTVVGSCNLDPRSPPGLGIKPFSHLLRLGSADSDCSSCSYVTQKR